MGNTSFMRFLGILRRVSLFGTIGLLTAPGAWSFLRWPVRLMVTSLCQRTLFSDVLVAGR